MKGYDGEKKLVKIGNYAMTGRLLGKGHFAQVHEATHIHLNVKVAVKVLTLSEVKDEYVIRNMRREARILAKVSHPNIIYLFETIMTTKRYYIITELVNGEDLCSYITAHPTGRLDEKSTRTLARQIISAVSHLHDLGIIHRDLKMENILLDNTKKCVKLVDFGLSNCRKGGKLLQTHCGSPEYAAPELYIKGKQYGAEVDIWSLGIIFYGMFVGKLPFQSWHKPGLSEEVKRKQLIRETKIGLTQRHHMKLMDSSLLFRNVLERMLCPNPEERITMFNLQGHAWIYGRFQKEYPPLDFNWKRLVMHSIAKMLNLSIDEVCETIETKRYSSLAGIYNIAKFHELQRRIEAEKCRTEPKELQKKRSAHIDLHTEIPGFRQSEDNSLRDPYKTKPIKVSLKSLKTQNRVDQNQIKAADVRSPGLHTVQAAPNPPTTKQRFVMNLGATINKMLHKNMDPRKEQPVPPQRIPNGKKLPMNTRCNGPPTNTAARAVIRAELDKRRH